MTTINITLPDEMKTFVESEVSNGGYGGAGEYLHALIREQQKRRAREELEAKLLEGIQSGEATPMTPEDWKDLKQEALARLANREPK